MNLIERILSCRCPECESQGLTPKSINVEGGACTAAYPVPFYDSEGRRHIHDTNRNTEDLRCSNGHTSTRVIPNTCWCGWKQEIEPSPQQTKEQE